jgi:hypothetical protein
MTNIIPDGHEYSGHIYSWGFEEIDSKEPEEDFLINMLKRNEEYKSGLPFDLLNKMKNNVDSIMDLLYDDEDIITIETMIEEKDVQGLNVGNVDNATLANVVADKIGYDFSKHIIIKPLEIEKVYKTLTVPEDSGEKDEEGEPIMQMTIKQIETESLHRTGVVIGLPSTAKSVDNTWFGMQINLGDVILFPKNRMTDFDLFKDSALVEPFDILGKKNI